MDVAGQVVDDAEVQALLEAFVHFIADLDMQGGGRYLRGRSQFGDALEVVINMARRTLHLPSDPQAPVEG
jgi:hypothetical protein